MGDQFKRCNFISAVKEGKLERVRAICLSVNPSYLQTWILSEGYNLLCYAVKNKHTDIVKLLLSYGSKVNREKKFEYFSNNGYTPLHYAVINGDIEIVDILLNEGADANVTDTYDTTPLYYAVLTENVNIVELLLRRGAFISNGDGSTILHIAVESGNIDIVEHLLNHRADINFKYHEHTSSYSTLRMVAGYPFRENTPLHLAVEGQHDKIVKLLLSRGANVDAKKKDGTTALHIATNNGNLQIIEHLLNFGANINSAYTSTFREGYTSLHLAVNGDREQTVKLLLSKGANVDAKGKDGKTALHIATERGNKKVLEHLLNHGANFICTCYNGKGCTALHTAASKNYREVVKLLLIRGANVDAVSVIGGTLISDAVYRVNLEMVEVLVKFGADINCEDENGRTALCVACERSFLLSLRRCDPIVDDQYWTLETIIKILMHHVIKMKTANLYVSKVNLKYFTSDDIISGFENECEKEIARMKSEKVYKTNVSFYDILTKGINQILMYAKNESIVEVLKSDDHIIEFPIYADMINNQFRKGKRRRELLEQSKKIFHFFFNNFELPQECIEKIFSYLSNVDLESLMCAY